MAEHRLKKILDEFYRDLPFVDTEYKPGDNIDLEGAFLKRGKVEQAQQAQDATKWNGRKLHESSTEPSDADEGDLWIKT